MFVNNIPGWLHDLEALILFKLTRPYNYQGSIGIEVGSLHGKSSSIMAQSIPLGTLYCIDIWDNTDSCDFTISEEIIENRNFPRKGMKNSLDFFKQSTKDFTNIKTIQGSSPECVQDWKQPVDFVFLDATHTNPNDRDNIDFWLPRIKKGGKFIGHDLNSNYPDVQENVKYLETLLNQKTFKVLSLWSFKV